MLNKKEFDNIRKDLKTFEIKRENVIALSRDIIHISKQIIYALHRSDMKSASKGVNEIKKLKKKLPNKKFDTDIDKVAWQEYVEALTYYHFLKSGKIPTRAALKVDTESYLLGLCDLSGELVRKAVNEVIKKNNKQAIKIKNLVEEIYGEFLKLNLRNGDIRRKSDQIKYNLKKLENIAYDIRTK